MRIILRWIFKKHDEGVDWIDLIKGSIRCGEFLDQLRTFQLLKKGSAPCKGKVYPSHEGPKGE